MIDGVNSRFGFLRAARVTLALGYSLLGTDLIGAQTTIRCADWDHAFTWIGEEYSSLGNVDGSMAIGDLTLDGIPDLVLGFPGGGPSGTGAGSAGVFFGPFRRGECRDLAVERADVQVQGDFPAGWMGRQLLVADLTDDGVNDLVITAQGAGAAYVLPGPLLGPQVIDVGSATGIWTVRGPESSNKLGWGASVGDLSGDGKADLVLAALYQTNPGQGGAITGAAYVIFGPVSPGTALDLAVTPADVVAYGQIAVQEVLAADLDDDGQDDLILGSSKDEYPLGGAVHAYFGPFLAGRTLDVQVDPPDVRVTGTRWGDNTGAMVAVGDVSGDGRLDLVVGSLSIGPGDARLDIFFGPRSRGDRLSPPSTDFALTSTACSGSTLLGATAAIADVTGDGSADLLAGDAGACERGTPDSFGAIYVFRGPISGGMSVDLASTPADIETFGTLPTAQLGTSLAVGDISGDGIVDIAAGEYYLGNLLNPQRIAGGAVSVAFGGSGFDCVPRPQVVTAVKAVRRLDDVDLAWDQAADASTSTYTVWKVHSGLSEDIRCANGAAEGAQVTAVCRAVPRISPACTDGGGVSSSPALAFYQVRGFCADGTEGLRHPW